MTPFTGQPLSVDAELETQAVLRKTASAHRYLAEFKGMATKKVSILVVYR